jgi:hypothetical protein
MGIRQQNTENLYWKIYPTFREKLIYFKSLLDNPDSGARFQILAPQEYFIFLSGLPLRKIGRYTSFSEISP